MSLWPQLALGVAASASALSPAPRLFEAQEPALGAPASFLVMARREHQARQVLAAVRAEISRLDAIFNHRRADAEISRLNRSAALQVSPELFEVLAAAEAWREASDGVVSGRLGAVLPLWRASAEPDAAAVRKALRATGGAVALDPVRRTVSRPDGVSFDLDGLAKGYIIDRALAAGRAACPEVSGLLIEIGGEARCAGQGPRAGGWAVGLPDPARPFINAPLTGQVMLHDQAIATSGAGPRDLWGRSATLDPRTGRPASGVLSATVTAPTAMEADALATALLVLPPEQGLALAERTAGAEARITLPGGQVRTTGGWGVHAAAARKGGWNDWQALLTFIAPRRVLERDPDFRSPYVAMWITDRAGRPVRTLVLVGRRKDWQRDNFIWWALYRPRAERLVEIRSMGTQVSGQYNVFWDGVDDDGRPVPLGDYVLHVETSREKGKHTYRTMPISFGKSAFKTVLPSTEEGGGMRISFDHY